MTKREIDSFCQKMDELIPRLRKKFLRRGPVVLAHDKITVPQMFILELLVQKESCSMGSSGNEAPNSTILYIDISYPLRRRDGALI